MKARSVHADDTDVTDERGYIARSASATYRVISVISVLFPLMARNVEIKARVRDARGLARRVRALCGRPVRRMVQEDTFFRAPCGRLKLRVTGTGSGELIAYERPDRPGPKRCEYDVVRVRDPAALRRALARALGVAGTVRKVRLLYMHRATRVHLDRVRGLGDFVELEVVLAPGQSAAYGRRVARGIMKRLAIAGRDLVDRAYIDLLETGKGGQ